MWKFITNFFKSFSSFSISTQVNKQQAKPAIKPKNCRKTRFPSSKSGSTNQFCTDRQIESYSPFFETQSTYLRQGDDLYLEEGHEDNWGNQQFLMSMTQSSIPLSQIQKKISDQNKLMTKIRRTMESASKFQETYTKIMGGGQQINRETYQDPYKIIYCQKIYVKRSRLYKTEMVDFPQLSYQTYLQINHFWSSSANPTSNVPLQTTDPLKKISLKGFQSLASRQWLNDEVVNQYILLMNQAVCRSQNNFTIVHSLFMPMLTKPLPRIEKALKKMGFQEDNNLIFAINYNFHWFFAVIQDQYVIIYDSIKKKKIQSYLSMDPVLKIVNFAFSFFKRNVKVEICQDFPQQQNGYDCGIMMLFGIKDVVRIRPFWSFGAKDTYFKRCQVGMEILEQKMTGF